VEQLHRGRDAEYDYKGDSYNEEFDIQAAGEEALQNCEEKERDALLCPVTLLK